VNAAKNSLFSDGFSYFQRYLTVMGFSLKIRLITAATEALAAFHRGVGVADQRVVDQHVVQTRSRISGRCACCQVGLEVGGSHRKSFFQVSKKTPNFNLYTDFHTTRSHITLHSYNQHIHNNTNHKSSTQTQLIKSHIHKHIKIIHRHI
jgi:hypothetical protein